MSLLTEQGRWFTMNPHKTVDVCTRVEVSSSHQVQSTIALGHYKDVVNKTQAGLDNFFLPIILFSYS